MRQAVEREVMNPWLVVGYLAEVPSGAGDRTQDVRKMMRFCKLVNTPWKKVVGPVRRRDYVEARQLISKYLKDQGWTYREIGELLGKRDHSTSVYAVKSANNLLDVEAGIRYKWLKLLQA